MPSKRPILTLAQRALLAESVEKGRVTCSSIWPPAKKLVALGLVTEREGKFGGYTIEPTELGRGILEGLTLLEKVGHGQSPS